MLFSFPVSLLAICTAVEGTSHKGEGGGGGGGGGT